MRYDRRDWVVRYIEFVTHTRALYHTDPNNKYRESRYVKRKIANVRSALVNVYEASKRKMQYKLNKRYFLSLNVISFKNMKWVFTFV